MSPSPMSPPPNHRPLLSIDPGPTIRRWGWFLWVTWAVIGTGLLGEDVSGGGFALGLVLSAPFWALWLLWPLYRAWALWQRWRGHEDVQRWQDLFEFEGRRIRLMFDAGRIWLAADDVFDALGVPAGERNPDRVRSVTGPAGLAVPPDSPTLLAFSEDGLRTWLQARREPEALRFRLWMDEQIAGLPRNARGVAS